MQKEIETKTLRFEMWKREAKSKNSIQRRQTLGARRMMSHAGVARKLTEPNA
jgi:hypothetical protein